MMQKQTLKINSMKFYKTYTENPDGTVCIGDSNERYTAEQFIKLQRLMPHQGWIGIVFPRPTEIVNPSYQPSRAHKRVSGKLQTERISLFTFKKNSTDEAI
jgi:hypothetical protein